MVSFLICPWLGLAYFLLRLLAKTSAMGRPVRHKKSSNTKTGSQKFFRPLDTPFIQVA